MGLITALSLSASIIGLPLTPVAGISTLGSVFIYVISLLILYVFASMSLNLGGLPPGPLPNRFGENVARGMLLGINASGHAFLLPVAYHGLAILFPVLLPLAGISVFLGFFLAGLNLMAGLFAGNRTYNAILGWTSFLSPMAWLVTFVGLLFMAVSVVIGLISGNPVRLRMEWFTCTLITHGRVPALRTTAYNLGNFAFITWEFEPLTPSPILVGTGWDFITAEGVTFHETGHTLNLAVFGSVFHYIGAIDQNVFQTIGADAYSELLAESQSRSSLDKFIPMWAPPIGTFLPGTSSNTPPSPDPDPWIPQAFPEFAAVGQTVFLDANVGISDPDNFPQGAINPGVSPPLGFLWVLTSIPQTDGELQGGAMIPNPSFVPEEGADYFINALATDGINGIRSAPPLTPMSVVQANANGPYTGTSDASVRLSAVGSRAGSRGVLPGVAPPPNPQFPLVPLNPLWEIVDGPAGNSLTNSTAIDPEFRGPAGVYTVRLTVTVTTAVSPVSHSDTTTITIT